MKWGLPCGKVMNGQRLLCAKASECAKASGPERDTVCSKLGEAPVAGGRGSQAGYQDVRI